jgi:hypothetical protein
LTAVAVLVALGVFAGSAAADGTLTIDFSAKAKIAKAEADIPVTVSCALLANQTSGSIVVTVEQASGSKTEAGTGSVPIVCDGTSHSYLVPVIVNDGHWHTGQASVSATGEADGHATVTTCGTDSNGNTICDNTIVPEHDSGVAGPASITLENS